MYKVFGGLGGKGFELRGKQQVVNMSPCDLVLLITMKHHWFLCLNGIVQVGVKIAKNTKA